MRTTFQNEPRDQYLVYCLGPEGGHGRALLKVQRIVGMMDVLQPPSRSRFSVEGGIEFRGKVLPLVDLRAKEGDEARSYDERDCIILVEDLCSGRPRLLGMVVESICE